MKVELLLVRHISCTLIMHLVEGNKLVLESRALFTAVTPLLLLILGNILTMSEDKIMALSGIPLAFNNSEMSVR